jgi:lysophospholipase L1-like esterase
MRNFALATLLILSCTIAGAIRGASADEVRSKLPRIDSRLSAGETTKIVCLGDSVTGVYYHTGGRRAYPEMLELALGQLYPKAKITVINAGISGNSTRNGLSRLQRDVLDANPDLVTVMFGLNDMVGVPVEEYRNNLKEIAERCRKQKAEVLFCTPNAIYDDGGRTTAKLIEYCGAMKDVGKELGIPVSDCYAAHIAARERDASAWRLMMSDAIHPNMDGHKLNAVAVSRSISGRDTSLDAIAPPQPAIPRTLKRLKDGEPLRVLAMAPVDEIVEKALHTVAPTAKVEVTKWITAGKTLQQLEAEAKEVRGKAVDLVVLAVPAGITPGEKPAERDLASFIWIMNLSLSFGRQEWDVIVAAPSVLNSKLEPVAQQAEDFTRRIVNAQDLSLIVGTRSVETTPGVILTDWLQRQVSPEKKLSIPELIDELKSKNKAPAPFDRGARQVSLFPKDYDWQDQARVIHAWGELDARVEESMLELANHADDVDYCVTFASSPVFRNFSVGNICRRILRAHLTPFIDRPGLPSPEWPWAIDGESFASWLGRRKGKRLYEIQLEVAELARGFFEAPGRMISDEDREIVLNDIGEIIEHIKKKNAAWRTTSLGDSIYFHKYRWARNKSGGGK